MIPWFIANRGTRWRVMAWMRLATWLLGVFFFATLAKAEAAPSEYEVKAELISNFPQFVDWPNGILSSPDVPLVIGVIGRDPFGRALDQLVKQAAATSRKLMVRRLRTSEGAKGCHILFISPSERANLPQILRSIGVQPVLTVGDFEGFAQRGGMIELFKDPEGKIRLRINLEAAKKMDLSTSAKLLLVADVVETKGE